MILEKESIIKGFEQRSGNLYLIILNLDYTES